MKRTLSLILALLVALGAFAICGAAEAEIPEVVIWGGVPAENGPQALCDAFNEKYAEQYHATYYRFVNDDSGNTKLETALLSGEQIDVFFSYGLDRITARANGGMMYDMSQIEGAEEWIKTTLVDGCLNYIDGGIYYIPTNNEPQFLFLNKDMFDEAGIAIPESWTFEEYKETAKALTTEEHYGAYSFRFDNSLCTIALGKDYYYNEDGTAANYNREEIKEIVQLVYDMHFVDQSVYPYGEVLSQGISAYPQDLLIGEDIAIIESSYWFLRYIKNTADYPHDFITAFAPMPTGGASYNNGALNNYVSIAQNAKSVEAAWTFVQFWLAEGYSELYVGGKIPVVREGVNEDELIAGLLGENAEALFDTESFLNVFHNVAPYSVQEYTVAGPEIKQIFNEERDNLYLGAYDVDTYLSTTDERITQAIADAT